jgi:hypothetical protein
LQIIKIMMSSRLETRENGTENVKSAWSGNEQCDDSQDDGLIWHLRKSTEMLCWVSSPCRVCLLHFTHKSFILIPYNDN